MTRRRGIHLSTVTAVVVVLATACYAQVDRLRVQRTTYRVKVVSLFNTYVTIGILGQGGRSNFRMDFDGRRPDEYTEDFYRGERVVCVWDRQGNIIYIAVVDISANGTLEIGWPVGNGAAAAQAPMDRLKIK